MVILLIICFKLLLMEHIKVNRSTEHKKQHIPYRINNKKAAAEDDLIYIDLALDLGLLHMLRLTALRGKSFLAN